MHKPTKPLTHRQLRKLARASSGDFSAWYVERAYCDGPSADDDVYRITWSHSAAAEFGGCGALFPEEWGQSE